MRTLALLIAGGVAALINAAQSTPPKQSEQPFSITITPLSDQVKAGAEVYVKVRLTNTSQREIGPRGIFYAQGLDTSFSYACHDASGKSVAKEFFAIGSLGEIPALHPGESRDETTLISNACDLRKPGKYQIQLSRADVVDPKRQIVKSNMITVTVVP
jgi:hypothetical protein